MEKSPIHTKIGLLLTTIEVIDESGVQGFSTKEVARRQGVSEGTLFRHYKTKNELLLAVLDYYSQYDHDIIQSIKIKKLTPRESITYFVNSYVEYYENYPAITAITQVYDILSCDHALEKKIRSIFDDRVSFIKKMIEAAQREGEINPNVESERLANLITGLVRETCLKWRLNRYEFSLKKEVISTLEMVLGAFS